MYNQTLKLFKNAYGGISKPIWLLSAAMFINRCGTMVFPFLSLYLTQYLHFSLADTGVILSIYGCGAFLGTFTGGYLTDRLGSYSIQVFALIFSGIMLLVLMFLNSFSSICIGIFIFTALGDTFRPANSAAIASYSNNENRTRSYTLNRLAINLGWAIGAGLGGFLAFYNYKLLFVVDGITCILAGIFLLIFLKPSKQNFTKNHTEETNADSTLSPYRDVIFMVFIGLTLVFAIAFFQLFTVIPVYFKTVKHLSEIKIGLLETLNGIIIVAVEMFLVFELEKRFKKANIIALGLLFTGISYLIFNLFGFTGVVVISLIFVTMGEMFAMPFMQSITVERSNPKNRGKYLALYAMTYSIAQVASPAIGTFVVSNYSYATLWYGTFVACCLSASGFYLMRNRLA
jgi:predicted MFS family arabinose efflux permease